MKKLLLFCLLPFLLAGSYAQTIVSTSPENKRVVVEDYSGVMWESPYSHIRTQHMQYMYPGQVFAICIHEGDNAVPGGDDYLDLRTPWGPALLSQTDYTADYLTLTVNRHYFPDYAHNSGTAMHASGIEDAVKTIMLDAAYVNVAAEAEIDLSTNELTVHVEAYYTANGTQSTNYLNVALVQNELVSWQEGRMSNPNYCTTNDNEYREMAVLRQLLTDQFGDEIATTTSGTFIDRTYNWIIPDYIEDIEVDLTNLEIVVFVAETTQEIINGNSCIPELIGPPIVKMEKSLIGVCSGETIQYKDLSASDITGRTWSFPGGTPSSSTEEFPVVEYQNPGEYNVTLSVTNSYGTSEHTFSNVVNVQDRSDIFCIEFDGWEASHWINTPYASELIAGTDQFSLMCWVFPMFYVDDWTHFGGIVGFREFSDAGGMSFYILQLGGTSLEARVETEDGMFTIGTPDGALELYEYQHLAVTYDGSFLRLYKNAELLQELEATGLYGNAGHVGLNIGGALLGNYTGWTFDGEVHEVTLWNKALNEQEIEQYMCIEQDPKTIDNLALYYTFSECSGSSIIDDKVGNYQGMMLDITDDNRISSEVCEYTGVAEKPLTDDRYEKVMVYPNPVKDIINITNCEGADAELLNMTGQVVQTQINVQGNIDVSSVPDGFYLLRIYMDGTQVVRKVNIRR